MRPEIATIRPRTVKQGYVSHFRIKIFELLFNSYGLLCFFVINTLIAKTVIITNKYKTP